MSPQKELTCETFEKLIQGLEEKDERLLRDAYVLDTERGLYCLQPKVLDDSHTVQHIQKLIHKTEKESEAHIPDTRITKLEQKLEELQTKLNLYEDTIKRQHAEFQNYRKRTEKEKEQLKATATEKLLEDLLPIIDSLEKAIELSDKESDINQFRDGVILIEKQIHKTLEQHGLERIESLDKEFDPSQHEALQIDTSQNNYKVSTIITEWQRGYTLNGKVIRPSKVVVAHPSALSEKKAAHTHNEDDSLESFLKQFECIPKEQFEDMLQKLTGKKRRSLEESYAISESGYTLQQRYRKDTHRLYELISSIKGLVQTE